MSPTPAVVGLTLVLGGAALTAQLAPEDAAAQAAERFLASLDEAQRERASLTFDDAARLDWHFIPRARGGVRLGELDEDQAAAARALFDAELSARGLQKVDGVIALEGVLRALESTPERVAEHRDPGAYHVTVFGSPAGEGPWAWRLEGHHISLNFTRTEWGFVGTPMFFGSNPRVVRAGEHEGLDLLGAEDELARRLFDSLDGDQQAAARLDGERPSEVLAPPGQDALPDPRPGLAAREMSAEQRGHLHALVEAWIAHLAPARAKAALARLREEEVLGLRFAFSGEQREGAEHGWWVLGEGLAIEWVTVGGGPDHVHAQWREPARDFGGGLGR